MNKTTYILSPEFFGVFVYFLYMKTNMIFRLSHILLFILGDLPYVIFCIYDVPLLGKEFSKKDPIYPVYNRLISSRLWGDYKGVKDIELQNLIFSGSLFT